MPAFKEMTATCPSPALHLDNKARVCRFLPLFVLITMSVFMCSCTLLTHSPYIAQRSTLPEMSHDTGLITSCSGEVPYQRWRVPQWEDDFRYVWLAGPYDFRRFDGVEIILFFHGMHSKDYYAAFRKELELLARKRSQRPFLFVGFVDSPYVSLKSKSKERWSALDVKEGDKPERLFQTINYVFKAFRSRFPNVKKERTKIVLAGFSGGGRVLNSIGNWLARSGREDPYAAVFRSRLSKIAYFDCWFDKDVIETVPALLENNPGIKIVSTVHMKKPSELATVLASKFKMKRHPRKRELVGLGGRLVILRGQSHWDAMISRLVEAL
jgi:hypothetical protein